MTAQKTVLVVDDDPDIVETTKMILESAGYRVETAASGGECLSKTREIHPDVIVLDVMMDRETEGFHVSYELKKDEETKGVPILVLSAVGRKSGFDYKPETDEDYLPVEAYMEKPLDPEALVTKVRELAGQEAG